MLHQWLKCMKDFILRANQFTSKTSIVDKLQPKQSRPFVSNLMNPSLVMQNLRNRKKCKIEGESSNKYNVIYAAKCTRCYLLFMGQTRGQLNVRFIHHKSAIKCNPYRSKLRENSFKPGVRI